MPIANTDNVIRRELQLTGAIVEENEIVTGAVHFRELNHAVLSSNTFRPQSQVSRSCRAAIHLLLVTRDWDKIDRELPGR